MQRTLIPMMTAEKTAITAGIVTERIHNILHSSGTFSIKKSYILCKMISDFLENGSNCWLKLLHRHPHIDKYGKPKQSSKDANEKVNKSPEEVKKKNNSNNAPPKLLKQPSTGITDEEKERAKQLEIYKTMVRLFTSKGKISADEKRHLRTYRSEHSISADDHFKILLQLGWSEDEYDDGEKVKHS